MSKLSSVFLVLLLNIFDNHKIYSQFSNEFPSIQVCFSSISYLEDPSVPIAISGLEFLHSQLMFKNCTHIVGSLVIAHLSPYANGSEPDLSFLHGIIDISGFLYIHNVTVSELSFPELRLIRGHYTLSVPQSPQTSGSLLITDNLQSDRKYSLGKISMPNLRSVLTSNILIFNNYGLCHMYSSVAWDKIIDDPERFSFISDSNTTQCSTTAICSSGCKNCFSEKENDCQQDNKCKERSCKNIGKRCYLHGGISEECCPQNCVAGCPGRVCYACANVLSSDNKCLPTCPPRLITHEGRRIPNPLFAFTFGPVCVKTCPYHTLAEGDGCVLECSQGSQEPNNGVCSPCGESCSKKCNMLEIIKNLSIDHSQKGITADVLHELKGCVHLKGDLIIDESTFQDDPNRRRGGAVGLAQLHDTLSALKTISGRLSIMNTRGVSHLRNLTFLQNLEEIGGRVSLDFTEVAPLSIVNSDIEFLGLKKLQKIGNVWNSIKLSNLPELCYQPTPAYLDAITMSDDAVQEDAVKSRTVCERENKVCDPMCSEHGCWGPGPRMCVKCKFLDAGGTCTKECSDVAGFYGNSTCLPCSPLCLQGCTGPLDTQCIGECTKAKDGGKCVDKCPPNKYLNTTTRECANCHEFCHAMKDGEWCSGPSTVPGPGGCSKCDTVQVDEQYNVLQCTSSKPCPDGTYLNFVTRNGKVENYFVSNEQEHYPACRPCHPLCPLCTSYKTKKETCLKCVGVWHHDTCLKTCPEDTYMANNSMCLPCHNSCKGCIAPGNGSCIECKRLKVYTNDYFSTNKEFYCSFDACPSEKPEQLPESNVHVCLDTVTYKRIQGRHQLVVAGTVVGALVILLIFIGLAVCFWRWKNRVEKQRLIEDLKNKLSNSEISSDENSNRESNSPSSVPLLVEDDRLIVVNQEDITYPPNARPLPKGRFGVVFQGRWHVPVSVSLKYAKEKRRVKLPVAIRVISQEQFLSYASPNRVETSINKIKTLAAVKDQNCLRLLGCYFDDDSCYLTTVFCENGSLDKYLRDNKPRIFAHTLLIWAEQIAKGMAYLEKVKIVHRNLAARNVFVVDENLVQITDYGLGNFLRSNPLTGPNTPMRWMAIEALRKDEESAYTVYSDIWAYGVTLWEMFTFGKLPYDDVDALDIKEHVEKGGRLQHPPICSLDVFLLMVKCWMEDPKLRISFTELAAKFRDFSLRPTTYLSIAGDPFQRANAGQEDNSMSMNDYEMNIRSSAPEAIETRNKPSYFFPEGSHQSNAFPTSLFGDSRMTSAEQPLLSNDGGDYLVPSLAGIAGYGLHLSSDLRGSGLLSFQPGSPLSGDGVQVSVDESEYLIPNPSSTGVQNNYGNNATMPATSDEYLLPTTGGDVTNYLEPSFADSPLYLHPQV